MQRCGSAEEIKLIVFLPGVAEYNVRAGKPEVDFDLIKVPGYECPGKHDSAISKLPKTEK